MKTAKTFALISAICAIGLLAGCGTQDKKETASSAGEQKDSLKSQLDVNGGKSADKAPETADSAAPTKPSDPNAAKGDDAVPPSGLPKGELNVDLGSLPAELVICTVGGDQVRVADYRNMLKVSQMQFQNSIANDPVARASVLQQAKQGHVELTSDEKTKLIDAAKKEHTDFAGFLKQNNISETDFDKQVCDAGVVFKAGNTAITQNLMKQLLQRTMLSKAAKEQGMMTAANSKYQQVKNTPEFKQLKERTGLSTDDLKNEFLNGELATMEIEKIGKGITVSDSEIRSLYDKNKSQLRHDERVRLSTILVLAPEQDMAGLPGIRSQLKQLDPKLTDKDIDVRVAQILQEKQNKALILLGEAKGAVDFAKLANENTDDPNSRARHNGGDLGWQAKSQLVPEFVDAVWNLKPGTVLDRLVKTQEGFRIIKVTGHEKPGILEISEVKPLLVAKLRQEKLQMAVNNWLNTQQQRDPITFSKRFLAQAGGSGKTH